MKPVYLFFSILFSCFLFTTAAQNNIPKTTPKEKKDKDDPITLLPQLVRGPYLQQATPKSILIRWRTDALSRSHVNFGTSFTSPEKQVTDSALVTEHKILLTGLQSATRYYYTIGDVKNKLQGDSGNYF